MAGNPSECLSLHQRDVPRTAQSPPPTRSTVTARLQQPAQSWEESPAVGLRAWRELLLQLYTDRQHSLPRTPLWRGSLGRQSSWAVQQHVMHNQPQALSVPPRSPLCPGSYPALPEGLSNSDLQSWVKTVHFLSLNLYYYGISKTTNPTTQLQKEFTEKCEAACVWNALCHRTESNIKQCIFIHI